MGGAAGVDGVAGGLASGAEFVGEVLGGHRPAQGMPGEHDLRPGVVEAERLPAAQPAVAERAGGGAVGGGTVQVYRAGGGFVGGQTAGQQRRKHPSQYIPAAAPGKPRVAGGVHAHPPIRACHHSACPLQHHHSIPCFRIAQRRAFPVRVDLCRRAPGQPGHLAGVGR